MASYEPPKENLPIFDADYFFYKEDIALTLGEAERLFVKNTNGFISNSLSVGGDTFLYGNLSIPSFPNVSTELTTIDISLNSIDARLSGISYYPTEILPYLADSTLIDNHFYTTRTSYMGNAIANYTFAGSGTLRRRRPLNLIHTDAALKIARFNNTNVPALEFEQWTDPLGTSTWGQWSYWQVRGENTGISFTNFVTSGVGTGTTPFYIGCVGTATPNNISYLPMDMNAQTISNVTVNSTTSTQADMTYDVVGKNWYYKDKAYGQFSSSQTQSISTNSASPTLFTYNTTANALNCSINTTTSQVKVLVQGTYRFTVSPNIEGNGSHIITFWFVKNGTAIPNSASQITISSGKSLPFVEVIETMNVNEYIEIAAFASSSGQQITAVAAASPVPALPSIILTVQRIS